MGGGTGSDLHVILRSKGPLLPQDTCTSFTMRLGCILKATPLLSPACGELAEPRVATEHAGWFEGPWIRDAFEFGMLRIGIQIKVRVCNCFRI